MPTSRALRSWLGRRAARNAARAAPAAGCLRGRSSSRCAQPKLRNGATHGRRSSRGHRPRETFVLEPAVDEHVTFHGAGRAGAHARTGRAALFDPRATDGRVVRPRRSRPRAWRRRRGHRLLLPRGRHLERRRDVPPGLRSRGASSAATTSPTCGRRRLSRSPATPLAGSRRRRRDAPAHLQADP